MPVDLSLSVPADIRDDGGEETYLRFDQNEIYKEDDVVVFNVFVAEAAAVLAHGEPHAVAAGLVIGAGVFGVERPDRIAAFYADGHFMNEEVA